VVSGLHGVSSVEMGGAITAGGAIRMARTSRGGAHYGLYRAGDGEWFFLGCLTQPFFLKALEALDMLELMAWEGVDGQLINIMANPELTERVRTALEAKFATAPRAHWLDLLEEAGVPRGPVGRREEWFREETVAANEMLVALDHPLLGRVEMPGLPVKLSDTPAAIEGFMAEAAAADLLVGWAPRQPPAADPPASTEPPLAGVRVIDIGAFIAGTFAPTVLANFGADVIKVEPLEGDGFRPYGLNFTGHNLGKRSLAIDLKSPAGREVLERLVIAADVVLDNFRLGVRERLGIDYASLARLNPRIITCSVTGYGPKGPLAPLPGFDPILQARSGMMRAQGGADEPVFHQIAVNDTATAMMAAFGILAALHARERTGRGQEVTTCLANQTILFQSGELTWYEGRPLAPTGARDCLGFSALRRFYRCADGWLGVSCTRPVQFHALAVALGHPEWAGRTTAEKALAEPVDGVLGRAVAETLATMPRAEALDRLLTGGVPAAPATGADELFTDPWLAENRFLDEIADPQWGRVIAPRTFADWSRSRAGFARRAPLIGEHSAEVLAECGFAAGEIERLIADGVVRAG
jgi:crotonobetainyl-CoA:carnitine CoA-transferase CaiB-like acyl-CoA transferase